MQLENKLPRVDDEGQRINNITFWVGRQNRGRLFICPECGGPAFEGTSKTIDFIVGLARRRMELQFLEYRTMNKVQHPVSVLRTNIRTLQNEI
jgi:hypothetical protein